MSVQDLYNLASVKLGRGAAALKHHGDNETEATKPMEFHIKDDEDAAGSNQMDIVGEKGLTIDKKS